MAATILFVDSKVEDYETLLASLGSDVEVHLLNAQEDGVLQMADFLKGRTGLDSIQVVSHGSSGSLSLGSGVLNNDSLSLYSDALSQIGSSLSAKGDILLYGCNVAQGDNGLQFIDNLAQYTGADVAASDNLTGKGGDWNLEVQTGSVESSSALNNLAIGVTLIADDYSADTSTYGYIDVGYSSSGTIETQYDSDWFYVYLTAGHQYQFDLKLDVQVFELAKWR